MSKTSRMDVYTPLVTNCWKFLHHKVEIKDCLHSLPLRNLGTEIFILTLVELINGQQQAHLMCPVLD